MFLRKIEKEDYYAVECLAKKAFWNINMPDGSNFDAFMGYELEENYLSKNKGKFFEPEALDCDIHDETYMKELEEFDKGFPYMEKKILPTQWR